MTNTTNIVPAEPASQSTQETSEVGLAITKEKPNTSEPKQEKKEKRVNLFEMIAFLLRRIRTDLEGGSNNPRWLRIVRAAENITKVEVVAGDTKEVINPSKVTITSSSGFLNKGVEATCGALVRAVAEMQNYTFKGEEFLKDLDAFVAILEVALGLIRGMISKEFYQPISDLLSIVANTDFGDENPLKVLEPGVTYGEKLLPLLPRPEDLRCIKEELYKLLVVVYEENSQLIDAKETGKIRMLQYAYYQNFRLYNVGYTEVDANDGKKTKKENIVSLRGLGISGIESNKEVKHGSITIYKSQVSGNNCYDQSKEANHILKALGYTGDKTGIENFQKLNGLVVDKTLNAETINQLMHLSTKYKMLKKAIPFDANKIQAIDSANTTFKTNDYLIGDDRKSKNSGTTDVWEEEGFPEAHKNAFMRVAESQDCIIMTRTPGEACKQLLEEGYDAKSFHIKAKSCQSGVAAGFLCLDPVFNKNGMKGALSNLKENHKSLNTVYESDSAKKEYKAGAVPLKISKDRVTWLTEKKFITSDNTGKFNLSDDLQDIPFYLRKDEKINLYEVFYDPQKIYGVNFAGLKSAIDQELKNLGSSTDDNRLIDSINIYLNKITKLKDIFKEKLNDVGELRDNAVDRDLELDDSKRKVLNEIKDACQYFMDDYVARLVEAKNKAGLVGKDEFYPVLAMTNPYTNHKGVYEYLNAVTGDYDLFAIWPKEIDAQMDERVVPLSSLAGKPTMNQNIVDGEKKLVDDMNTVRGNTTGTVVGNISERIYMVGQLINSEIADSAKSDVAHGRGIVNRVFHSDEGGRPFVDEVDTAVAFTPFGKAFYLKDADKKSNGTALTSFAEKCDGLGYRIVINPGWYNAFKSYKSVGDTSTGVPADGTWTDKTFDIAGERKSEKMWIYWDDKKVLGEVLKTVEKTPASAES